jgi:hypothetical protein
MNNKRKKKKNFPIFPFIGQSPQSRQALWDSKGFLPEASGTTEPAL